jgi:lipoprotein-releasing system permease protein
MLVAAERGTTSFAEVQGIDPTHHAAVIPADGGEDPFQPLSRPTASGRVGIVIGWNLALHAGVSEGDLVRLVVPHVTLTPWGATPRSHVFEVVGTYRSDHFQQDSQRAYVPLEAARRLLRAPGVASWVEIRLDEVRDLPEMKSFLRQELGAPWYVVDLIEQNEDLLKALNTEKLALFLAIGLIVIVAALNIVSTLILMVTDKIREIGTLSAMGARPGAIATVFILQGGVIGGVGTLVGTLLGTVVSLWLDRYELIPLNPDVYYLTHIPFAPNPRDIAVVAVSAIVVSLLATIYPATKAASLDPVEAIRHE